MKLRKAFCLLLLAAAPVVSGQETVPPMEFTDKLDELRARIPFHQFCHVQAVRIFDHRKNWIDIWCDGTLVFEEDFEASLFPHIWGYTIGFLVGNSGMDFKGCQTINIPSDRGNLRYLCNFAKRQP